MPLDTNLETIRVEPDFKRQALIIDAANRWTIFRLPYERGLKKHVQKFRPDAKFVAEFPGISANPFGLPLEDQVQRNFLFYKEFGEVTRLHGSYDKHDLMRIMEEMAQNSDDRTINVYFLNLDGSERCLAIRKKVQIGHPDSDNYLITPYELWAAINKNRGVNLIGWRIFHSNTSLIFRLTFPVSSSV